MNRRAAFLGLVLSFVSVQTQAQDFRGEIATRSTTYRGTTANAPIPPEFHIRNEGGSDGAGLCVISSILANGRFQDVPGLERGKDSELWRTAKVRPGGYSPAKLEALVNEVMPDELWASSVGTDPSILAKLSALGYPIGATMNTGSSYYYQPIHHMISLVHYDNEWACVVDNNDPGKYHWMPASEFAKRWIDGGVGWAWIWTRAKQVRVGEWVVVLSAALTGLIVWAAIRAPRAYPEHEADDFESDVMEPIQ
jgi:hypothetical protein